MKNKETKTHSLFSCSSSERWINCPGSIELSKSAPPQIESDYAREGTDAHYCLEQFLLADDAETTCEFLLKKYPQDMVSVAYDTYRLIASLSGGHEVIAEQKVDTTPFIGVKSHGTLDCAIVEPFGRLTIIDYKYGAGIPVEPEENTQLILYALGMLHAHHYNFLDVSLMIIQPRAPHENGPVREWITSVENLIEFGRRIRDAATIAQKPGAPLAAGAWCKFCPAAAMCPEISKKAMRDAAIEFSDDLSDVAPPFIDSIDVAHLPAALRAADKIETWIDALRKRAFLLLERGEKIDGYKLVAKRSIRKWIDEVETARQAEKLFGDKAFQKSLLSPAQFEKVIDEPRWFTSRVSNVSSGLTMVSEVDKRPSVNRAQIDFDDSGTKTINNLETLEGEKCKTKSQKVSKQKK